MFEWTLCWFWNRPNWNLELGKVPVRFDRHKLSKLCKIWGTCGPENLLSFVPVYCIALNSKTLVRNNSRTVPSGNRAVFSENIIYLHNLSNLWAKFELLWPTFKVLRKGNSFWAFLKISPKITAEQYTSRGPARGHFWSS
jgi:hypothetical protein